MTSRLKTEGIDAIKEPGDPIIGHILPLKFISVTLVQCWLLLGLFYFSLVAKKRKKISELES